MLIFWVQLTNLKTNSYFPKTCVKSPNPIQSPSELPYQQNKGNFIVNRTKLTLILSCICPTSSPTARGVSLFTDTIFSELLPLLFKDTFSRKSDSFCALSGKTESILSRVYVDIVSAIKTSTLIKRFVICKLIRGRI